MIKLKEFTFGKEKRSKIIRPLFKIFKYFNIMSIMVKSKDFNAGFVKPTL